MLHLLEKSCELWEFEFADESAIDKVSSMSNILIFGLPATAKYFLFGEIVNEFTC